jgi:hypothetical protein
MVAIRVFSMQLTPFTVDYFADDHVHCMLVNAYYLHCALYVILSQVTKDEFKEVLGIDPRIVAVHAGLECGLLGEKFHGMDMVSS